MAGVIRYFTGVDRQTYFAIHAANGRELVRSTDGYEHPTDAHAAVADVFNILTDTGTKVRDDTEGDISNGG